MNGETLFLMFFQIVILGLFLFIAKKVLSSKNNVENTCITYSFFEREMTKQREDFIRMITEIKNDIACLKKELISFIKSHKERGD